MKTTFLKSLFGSFLLSLIFSGTAFAEDKLNQADTAWLLISSALVMLMLPGLALFYGGMVRRKNVLGTLMHSFVPLGVITLQWVIIGYSLSFGPDVGKFILFTHYNSKSTSTILLRWVRKVDIFEGFFSMWI